VLLPHGGPADRDVDGFDWLAHFLASRGFAVLQPNFRGSAGYGRAWEEAGHGGWGIGALPRPQGRPQRRSEVLRAIAGRRQAFPRLGSMRLRPQSMRSECKPPCC
jgi:predicted dienelactone hydrolase